MSQVAADVQSSLELPVVESSETKRTYRLDGSHARISRAEDTLRVLRQRIERHHDQEIRLGQLYQGWQECWSNQCDQMRQQVARIEAHLSAWLPKSDAAPTLSVVDGE